MRLKPCDLPHIVVPAACELRTTRRDSFQCRQAIAEGAIGPNPVIGLPPAVARANNLPHPCLVTSHSSVIASAGNSYIEPTEAAGYRVARNCP